MEDADAIRECRQGEVEAFSHLVYRYQGRALAHARALIGNDADAADAAQNAFLDAFRHLGRFDETREFYPWFYVLLRNRCIKGWARATDRAASSDVTDRPAPAAQPTLPGAAPAQGSAGEIRKVMTMTMRSESRSCDEFQMAAMAVLDGEVTTVAAEEIHAHVAGCEVCGAALAGLTSLNAAMARVRFDEPGVDLWPAIRANVAPAPQRQAARDMTVIAGLATAIGGWRLAQLLVDLPAPVVNSTVPLALVVLVLWRFVGDPFAIQVSAQRLHGDRS